MCGPGTLSDTEAAAECWIPVVLPAQVSFRSVSVPRAAGDLGSREPFTTLPLNY